MYELCRNDNCDNFYLFKACERLPVDYKCMLYGCCYMYKTSCGTVALYGPFFFLQDDDEITKTLITVFL